MMVGKRPAKRAWPSIVCSALSAAATGLFVSSATPAHAEFEIQEATIEQGEIQIQYRGAEHWGLADPEDDPLRQSHELELQMGITDYWLLSVTPGFEQPLGQKFGHEHDRGRYSAPIPKEAGRRGRSRLPGEL
jgi:hypothetical protein